MQLIMSRGTLASFAAAYSQKQMQLIRLLLVSMTNLRRFGLIAGLDVNDNNAQFV